MEPQGSVTKHKLKRKDEDTNYTQVHKGHKLHPTEQHETVGNEHKVPCPRMSIRHVKGVSGEQTRMI